MAEKSSHARPFEITIRVRWNEMDAISHEPDFFTV